MDTPANGAGEFLTWVAHHPAGAISIAIVALIAGVIVVPLLARALRAPFRGRQPEDVLTIAAASVATAVAMNGMWRFATNVLHFTGAERVALFAFLELALVTEAFRARRNIRDSAARAGADRQSGGTPERVSAGSDGVAVWVISILSGVFASLDATSGPAALFRLMAPLVAAWLWERGLSLYRRRLTGRRAVNWRFTPERVAVALGFADASERTADEADTARRLGRLARSGKRARTPGWGRRWWASHRLDAHLAAAVAHTKLATDQTVQRQLRQTYGAILGAEAFTKWTPQPPWATAKPTPEADGGDRQKDHPAAPETGGSKGARTAASVAAAKSTYPGLPLTEVAERSGIPLRTLQRYSSPNGNGDGPQLSVVEEGSA